MPKTVQRDDGWRPFGQWLRERRLRQRWTQEELATRLGYAKGVVQAWERGQRLPLRSQVAELIAVFKDDGARAQEWWWRAGYVPPDLWPLVDNCPPGSRISLSLVREPRREVGA